MLTREELEQLSDEELLTMLDDCETEVSKCNVMQLGLKVTLNSAYGMIGNEYSRYFDTRIAEGITVSGQLSIRWIERKLDEYLNKVCGTDGESFAVAGDTDSIYISLAPLVDKFMPGAEKEVIINKLDKICSEKLEPHIDAAYQELADYMNAFDQKMFMKREVIADRGLWRAKKNYALNVWDSEGVRYDEPHIKVMGIESTRSSTPEICRDAIKETLKLIMTTDEKTVQAYIKGFKEKFYSSPVEDISRNSGVSDLEKWHCKEGFLNGTPWHVKAAMVYNRMIHELKITNRYKTIRSGDKIKLVYLKKANPTHNKVIGYPDILPPEFDLDKFIDRNVQYDKNYLSPVMSLLTIIGWNHEAKNTLW